MKWNPVYKRELTVSSRSIRMTMILLIFNSILAVAALFNMFSVMEQVKATAEIQYSRFLELYIFVSSIEFVMLTFIMPALTSSSISGERERQTLDLMLTTTMKPRDIVFGKLWYCLTTMLLLAVSALPIQALVFVYGGITVPDVIMLFLCYAIVALCTGGLGMFFSSFLRRSTLATVCSYAVLVLLAGGTYALNRFVFALDMSRIDSYVSAMNTAVGQASSGGFLYLLLLNPLVTFFAIINGQAGTGNIRGTLEQWFGAVPDNFVTGHWVAVSLLLQLLLAVVFVALSIRFIEPEGMRKREKRGTETC